MSANTGTGKEAASGVNSYLLDEKAHCSYKSHAGVWSGASSEALLWLKAFMSETENFSMVCSVW